MCVCVCLGGYLRDRFPAYPMMKPVSSKEIMMPSPRSSQLQHQQLVFPTGRRHVLFRPPHFSPFSIATIATILFSTNEHLKEFLERQCSSLSMENMRLKDLYEKVGERERERERARELFFHNHIFSCGDKTLAKQHQASATTMMTSSLISLI